MGVLPQLLLLPASSRTAKLVQERDFVGDFLQEAGAPAFMDMTFVTRGSLFSILAYD